MLKIISLAHVCIVGNIEVERSQSRTRIGLSTLKKTSDSVHVIDTKDSQESVNRVICPGM